jgi:hypothetical protein
LAIHQQQQQQQDRGLKIIQNSNLIGQMIKMVQFAEYVLSSRVGSYNLS